MPELQKNPKRSRSFRILRIPFALGGAIARLALLTPGIAFAQASAGITGTITDSSTAAKRFWLALLVSCSLVLYAPAQTTNGLVTGVITDSTGAIVPDAQIEAKNISTGLTRSATSTSSGDYIVPQLAPGAYSISVKKVGFATVVHENVQLQVNQSITLNFQIGVASTEQTVEVTSAAPLLNTTSSTLGVVIGHKETVELPLNGREFTQLTLLTPGAAPVQNGQQTTFTVALGSGGISPSVNGQRGEQNNFTMDGILNNEIYLNTWIIAPPPDALQEFNVQSHITDAQFSISSGANINVVSRAGTNNFHGDVWEFVRNSVLDAQTYPDTQRLPYTQNQYGFYLGGPMLIPHLYNGKNKTWFSAYWEGYRSNSTNTYLANVLTPAQLNGDFSGVLGTTVVGTDSLGRSEYANEIYDPATSRPDPALPGTYLRDPFPGNIIPKNRFSPATLQMLSKYYPAPNLNMAEGALPNYRFTGATRILSDISGIRLDHQITANDTIFLRFNHANQNKLVPEALPTYTHTLRNYGNQAAVGYTHLFDPKTIVNFRYGYSYANYAYYDAPAGASFNDSINFSQAAPEHAGISLGPQISIANGYTGVSQFAVPLGPLETMDYHVDLSKVVGNHTLGVGGMYYHLRSFDDGWLAGVNFTQNATSQNATAGPTGYGPASFLLGVPHSYTPWIGNTAASQTENWYGWYAQDQWQATKGLVLTAGIRWDYVSPPNYHKIVSGLDVLTGKFLVTGPVPPLYPQANAPSGYFAKQFNGWEPRFGVTYQATPLSVIHAAFAMLDDHNNTLIQENQNMRLTWPSGMAANLTNLDQGVPQFTFDTLPSAASLLGTNKPYASYGANPNNKIPYVMEYNLGVQQQLTQNTALKFDYVGSVGRHQYFVATANTATVPGPGPISARQPYAQFGGPFSYSYNAMPSSYNALQAQLQRTMSSGLYFLLSYTYSKSMDWTSDPYVSTDVDFYHLDRSWGVSDYDRKHMFVLSGVYGLPLGKGKLFLSNPNKFAQAVAGNWSLGSILTMNAGAPFHVFASGDIANTGSPAQRAQRLSGNPYNRNVNGSTKTWLNKAAFSLPAQYTFGNEQRNDLIGPAFKNWDVNVSKTFPIHETFNIQFRTEFFNAVNHSNYANPNNGVQSASFGKILGVVGKGRQVQFAVKAQF